jgi:hypothetical protein
LLDVVPSSRKRSLSLQSIPRKARGDGERDAAFIAEVSEWSGGTADGATPLAGPVHGEEVIAQ